MSECPKCGAAERPVAGYYECGSRKYDERGWFDQSPDCERDAKIFCRGLRACLAIANERADRMGRADVDDVAKEVEALCRD